jgi:AcrR family transcriptional regulator
MGLAPQKRRPGPRLQRVDTTRILDAAQAVFSRAGLQAASIRAIAGLAGCDPALIYYHFDSKEALFLALARRRLPPIGLEMAALADPKDGRPTRDRLWAALEIFHRHLGEDAGFRSVFRGQLIQGSEATKDEVAALLRPIVSQLLAILQQGQARGELREDLDPRTAAFFIGRMHMEILDLLPTMGPRMQGILQGQSLEQVRRAWLDFAWRAIAARAGTEAHP